MKSKLNVFLGDRGGYDDESQGQNYILENNGQQSSSIKIPYSSELIDKAIKNDRYIFRHLYHEQVDQLMKDYPSKTYNISQAIEELHALRKEYEQKKDEEIDELKKIVLELDIEKNSQRQELKKMKKKIASLEKKIEDLVNDFKNYLEQDDYASKLGIKPAKNDIKPTDVIVNKFITYSNFLN